MKFLKRQSEFTRSVVTLMTGTTIAQAIPVAITPILTRLYTPDDFGMFGLYVGIAAVLSAAASGRYELAVMLPKSDDDADALVVLSTAIAVASGVGLFLIALLSHTWIADFLGQPKIAPWLFLLPVSVSFAATYNALNFWLNRRKDFHRMSGNRMLQASLGGASQIALGICRLGAAGLIFGQLLGVILTTLQLAIRFVRLQGVNRLYGHLNKSPILLRRYRNHPSHLLPSHIIGAGAVQLPLIAIAMLYGTSAAGFFVLAYRLVILPSAIIANAIGDVYRERASVSFRETGQFRNLFLPTLGVSAMIGLVPALAIFLIAPDLFAFVFGEEWRVAGDYARILVVAAYLQFVSTPVDKGALIIGATRYIFIWHALRLFCFAAAFSAGWYLSLSIEFTLALFVVSNAFVYSLDIIVGYQFSGSARSKV